MLSLDLETELIAPGNQAPRPACAQLAGDIDPILAVAPTLDEYAAVVEGVLLVARASVLWPVVERVALCPPDKIVGQNLCYDLRVIAEHGTHGRRLARFAAVVRALDRGDYSDVRVREKLLDIARGEVEVAKQKYDLGTLGKRYGLEIDKESEWRLRYGELAEVPIARWSDEAVQYVVGDAAGPLKIREWQDQRGMQWPGIFKDEAHQIRKEWALGLVAGHGVRIDPVAFGLYDQEQREEMERDKAVLCDAGLMVQKPKKKTWHRREKQAREMAARLWRERGIEDFPKTAGGAAEMKAETLFGLRDPVMDAYARYSQLQSSGSRIEEWRPGLTAPVHTRYDLASSGRSTSSDPNEQNRKVQGRDRECVAEMESEETGEQEQVILDIDHDGLELSTVSQVLIWQVGYSQLAQALIEGRDPHIEVAAQILGCSAAEARRMYKAGDADAYLARQTGKALNFSCAGGGGAKKISIEAANKYGVYLPVERWKTLIEKWKDTWPEFREYFRIVRGLTCNGRRALIRHHVTGRYRGNLIYTETANTFFQGLGADLTADVCYELARRQYATPGHPLHGCRTLIYVHDQYLVAVPRDKHLTERARALEGIVCGVAQRWLPDLRPTAQAAACRRWSKRARRVERPDGTLAVWELSELVEAIWREGGLDPEDRDLRAEVAAWDHALDTADGEREAKERKRQGKLSDAERRREITARAIVAEMERRAGERQGDRYKAERLALDAALIDAVPGYDQDPDVEWYLAGRDRAAA